MSSKRKYCDGGGGVGEEDNFLHDLCMFCCKSARTITNSNQCSDEIGASDNCSNDRDENAVIIKNFIKFLEGFVGWGSVERDILFGEEEVGAESWKEMGSCEKCVEIINCLSSVYHQLKCLELQLISKLETLVEGMKLVESIPSEGQKREQKRFKRLQSFRMDVINKCTEKLSKCQPRVLVERDKGRLADWISRQGDDNDAEGGDTEERRGDTLDFSSNLLIMDAEDPELIPRYILKEEINENDDMQSGDEDPLSFHDDFDSNSLVESVMEAKLLINQGPQEVHKQESLEDAHESDLETEKRNSRTLHRCKFFQKCFSTPTTLEKHFIQEHSKSPITLPEKTSASTGNGKKFHCDACDTYFTMACSLSRHIRSRCKSRKQQENTQAKQPTEAINDSAEKVVAMSRVTSGSEKDRRYNLREKGQTSYQKLELGQDEEDENDMDFGDNSDYHSDGDGEKGDSGNDDNDLDDEEEIADLKQQEGTSDWRGKKRPCPECGQVFYRPNHLKKHMARVHPGVEFEIETSHHPGVRYTFHCILDNCKRRFATEAELDEHTTRHPYKDAELTACPECDKEIKSSYLRKHIRQCHTTFTRSHECTVCSKLFKKKEHLTEHSYIHQDPELWRFQCAECGKKCITKSRLNKHMRSHSGERPFVCQYCPRRYSQRQKLNLHLRTKHRDQCGDPKEGQSAPKPRENERSHLCPDCGKAFASKRSLSEHLLIHMGPEAWRFQCSKCGKLCRTKGKLNRHMWTHANKKPLPCQFCGVQFDRKENLDEHVRSEHGDDEFEQTPVPVKSKKKKTAGNDDDAPIVCGECGKVFKEKRYLRDHLLIHRGSDAWKHTCPECGKKCATKSSYNRHMKSHANVEGGIDCQFCGVNCARRETLMLHMSRYHPEEHEKMNVGSAEQEGNGSRTVTVDDIKILEVEVL